MRFGPLAASLLGSLGGSSLGGRLFGQTGSLGGSLVGSIVAGSAASKAGQGGGIGGLLGGLLGSHATNVQSGGTTNLIATSSVPDLDDTHGEILLRAMCAAAKSDGTVDADERQAIIRRMGAVTDQETAWLDRELAGPVDLDSVVASVPSGFGPQVYGASLLAVGAESGPEASFLQQLSQRLGLSGAQVTEIHRLVGVA